MPIVIVNPNDPVDTSKVFVADSKALVWWLAEDGRPSQKARGAFEKVISGKATLVVPKAEWESLKQGPEADSACAKLTRVVELVECRGRYGLMLPPAGYPEPEAVAALGDQLTPRQRELLAVALTFADAAVITDDQKIKESGLVKIAW
jgi:hypothetical protein